MGLDPQKKRWTRDNVLLALTTDQKEAITLMEESYIHHTPTVLRFPKPSAVHRPPSTVPSSPSTILYGRFAHGSDSTYLTLPILEKLVQAFESGDRDKRLLRQLRAHLAYLPVEAKERDQWRVQVDNAYQSQLTFEDLNTYAGYRVLTQEVNDVRMDLFKRMLQDQEAFQKLIIDVEEKRR